MRGDKRGEPGGEVVELMGVVGDEGNPCRCLGDVGIMERTSSSSP
jgi:hypothetical protein